MDGGNIGFLSFGDSLYLHPNDTGGSPIVTIKLIGTENYKMWSIAMKFALRNHNKLGFIDGTCKRDDKNVALANQWDMCNSVVDTYDKVDGSAVFNMHKIINSLNQNGASLADYYNNLNSLWKQFDAMISFPPCTCEAAKHFEKHNQLIKLMQFLMGLDDSYFAIRSNILTREPLPSVKAAFAVVSANTFDKERFNSNNFNSNNKGSSSNSNSNNTGLNPNLKCTNCNKIGHSVDSCFELFGYPAGYVKRNFNSNTRPVSSNNASADVHSNNVKISRILKELFLMEVANQHITVSAKILINVVDISNLGLTVGHPNGTQALITKIGDLKSNNDITLYDVLVVPEYTVSLLSIHKLSRDSKLYVGFNESVRS
ncbi:ribonuclease H-like domain-containing protein [Tanacetum coccineum]